MLKKRVNSMKLNVAGMPLVVILATSLAYVRADDPCYKYKAFSPSENNTSQCGESCSGTCSVTTYTPAKTECKDLGFRTSWMGCDAGTQAGVKTVKSGACSFNLNCGCDASNGKIISSDPDNYSKGSYVDCGG